MREPPAGGAGSRYREHVRVELPNASRIRVRPAAGAILPLAVLLSVIVIAAAGIGGTSHFTGPRWYPHLGGGAQRSHVTLLPKPPKGLRAHKAHGKPGRLALPLWLELLLGIAVAVGIGVLLLRLWGKRRAPAAPGLQAETAAPIQVAAPEQQAEPEVVLTGIRLALHTLDQERDPADAVVRAWLGLQETAEESGIVRGPSETPTEFATRVLSSAVADDRAMRTLLRLYLRTRFGDHPVTPEDVAAVRTALQQLLDELARGGAGRHGHRGLSRLVTDG